MSETSVSLLDRLRHDPDAAAWQRLVNLYTPLVRGWLNRQGARPEDADDVAQEVMVVVVRKLRDFERRDQVGSFRAWLRTITLNCLRDFWRARRNRPQAAGDGALAERMEQLADPHSGLSEMWNREHDQHVAQALLELIRPRFTENTWEAFRRVTVEGQSADTVATSLGMSVNAVLIAKSRVLTQLRQEGAGILE